MGVIFDGPLAIDIPHLTNLPNELLPATPAADYPSVSDA